MLETSLFVPKQSASVGSKLEFNYQIQDVNNNAVDFHGNSKVFIFANTSCGSCRYITFPLIEWANEFKSLEFYYIELSSEMPVIYYELRSSSNFHVIIDNDKYFYSIFKEPSTPSVFFVDENNTVIWKRTGFLVSDYKEYEQRIKDFSLGKKDFSDFQVNISTEQILPKISYISEGKEIILPDQFLGKDTLIFFLLSSCKSCQQTLSIFPQYLSEDQTINKVIVFAGINEDTVSKNLDFATHFSLKDLEMEVKQVERYKYMDIDEVRNLTKNFTSILIIEDNYFFISKRLGLVGGPFLCILNSKGEVLGIYSIGFDNAELLESFFESSLQLLD